MALVGLAAELSQLLSVHVTVPLEKHDLDNNTARCAECTS